MSSVDTDVSWQLWVGHQLNLGARLYRDIIEVNPPLWFWLALPVDRIADLLQLRSDAVLLVAVNLAVALSLVACAPLLAWTDPPRRTLILGYFAFLLEIVPWWQTGQREHLVLVGALPYALLIAARRDGGSISPVLAAAVGASAAIGFALKPYFLLVPAVLEIALIARQGRHWRPLRSETVGMATIGGAYAISLILFAPDYLNSTLPMVLLGYGATGAPSFADLIRPEVVVGVTAVALAFLARGRAPRADSVTLFLALAALAFAASYFIQAKGWSYHTLPVLGCGCAVLAVARVTSVKPSRLMLLVSPALLACPLVIAVQTGIFSRGPSEDFQASVAGLPSGTSIGVLATESALAWPLAYQRRLNPASRYMHFWMMRAVIQNELRGSPNGRLTNFGQRVATETVDDLVCAQPTRIIAARPQPGEDGFDIYRFFLRDPGFLALLRHYREVSRTSVDTFQLRVPLSRDSRVRACARKGLVFP
jgi:hypothetical protein